MNRTEEQRLLESAAKAVGLVATEGHGALFCWTESEYPRGSGNYGALWNYQGWGESAQLWNPLTDDGDAFRLAVQLKLTICLAGDNPTRIEVSRDLNPQVLIRTAGYDSRNATRCAIVHAAARLWDIHEAFEAPIPAIFLPEEDL